MNPQNVMMLAIMCFQLFPCPINLSLYVQLLHFIAFLHCIMFLATSSINKASQHLNGLFTLCVVFWYSSFAYLMAGDGTGGMSSPPTGRPSAGIEADSSSGSAGSSAQPSSSSDANSASATTSGTSGSATTGAAVEDRTDEFQVALINLLPEGVGEADERNRMIQCLDVAQGCINVSPAFALPRIATQSGARPPCRLHNADWTSGALKQSFSSLASTYRSEFLGTTPTPLHVCAARIREGGKNFLLARALVALVLRTGGTATWNVKIFPNSWTVLQRVATIPRSVVAVTVLQHAAALRALDHVPEPPLTDADFDERGSFAARPVSSSGRLPMWETPVPSLPGPPVAAIPTFGTPTPAFVSPAPVFDTPSAPRGPPVPITIKSTAEDDTEQTPLASDAVTRSLLAYAASSSASSPPDRRTVPTLFCGSDTLFRALSNGKSDDNIAIAIARTAPEEVLNVEGTTPLQSAVANARSLRLIAALLSRMPALDLEFQLALETQDMDKEGRPLTLTGWKRVWEFNVPQHNDEGPYERDMRPSINDLLRAARVWYAEYHAHVIATLEQVLTALTVPIPDVIVSLIAEHLSVYLDPFDPHCNSLWHPSAASDGSGAAQESPLPPGSSGDDVSRTTYLIQLRRDYRLHRHTAWNAFWRFRSKHVPSTPMMRTAHDVMYRALFQIHIGHRHGEAHAFARVVAEQYLGCSTDIKIPHSQAALDALDTTTSALDRDDTILAHRVQCLYNSSQSLAPVRENASHPLPLVMWASVGCRLDTPNLNQWMLHLLMTPQAVHRLWERCARIERCDEAMRVSQFLVMYFSWQLEMYWTRPLQVLPTVQRPPTLLRLAASEMWHAGFFPVACELVRLMSTTELHDIYNGTPPLLSLMQYLDHSHKHSSLCCMQPNMVQTIMLQGLQVTLGFTKLLRTFMQRITLPEVDLDPCAIPSSLKTGVVPDEYAQVRNAFEGYRNAVHAEVAAVLFVTVLDATRAPSLTDASAAIDYAASGLPTPINFVVFTTMSYLFPSYTAARDMQSKTQDAGSVPTGSSFPMRPPGIYFS